MLDPVGGGNVRPGGLLARPREPTASPCYGWSSLLAPLLQRREAPIRFTK